MSTDALYFTTHPSVIGKLVLVASVRGVRYLSLLGENEDAFTHLAHKFDVQTTSLLLEMPGFFATAIAAIDEYFNRNTPLKLPYDLAQGTALQRAVWLEIAKIPYGETISYSQLAERVGFPRAVRAVASACGANPVPLIIPCHRIVAKDGSLGGFSLGGLDVKELLLAAELRSVHPLKNSTAAA